MTQIINLPEINTLTNNLFLIAVDVSDSNKTKKIHLNQLIPLAAGPRGALGPVGPAGPSGPPGPVGTIANQSLNTSNSVTFTSLTISSNTGLIFSDNSVQQTAYRRTVRDIPNLNTNINLTITDLKDTILSINPTAAGLNVYLPEASASFTGIVLVIRNRSATYSFDLWAGLSYFGTIDSPGAITIGCDGYNWFIA